MDWQCYGLINILPNILMIIYTYLPPLAILKVRHLSGSAFCWVDIGLPEQAVGWFPPRFGIGCGRWTYWAFMYVCHSPLSEAQRSVHCSGWRGRSRVAMTFHHRLGWRETGATSTDSEWMAGATTTLASTDQCLLGGTSLRTRGGGGGGGGGLGGWIDVEDKPCVGICLFRPGVIINAAYIQG